MKGSVVEYKDCMKFAFFCLFFVIVVVGNLHGLLRITGRLDGFSPRKKNITSTEIHLIFIQSRAIVFSIIFFRSAFLCYLFEFNRNSMDVKETVEQSRDSMNPTEICCECDCVILFWVFFLLIYLEIHMHEYLVWVALSSHVTQYNIHLI